jgi:hypothetical protein
MSRPIYRMGSADVRRALRQKRISGTETWAETEFLYHDCVSTEHIKRGSVRSDMHGFSTLENWLLWLAGSIFCFLNRKGAAFPVHVHETDFVMLAAFWQNSSWKNLRMPRKCSFCQMLRDLSHASPFLPAWPKCECRSERKWTESGNSSFLEPMNDQFIGHSGKNPSYRRPFIVHVNWSVRSLQTRVHFGQTSLVVLTAIVILIATIKIPTDMFFVPIVAEVAKFPV